MENIVLSDRSRMSWLPKQHDMEGTKMLGVIGKKGRKSSRKLAKRLRQSHYGYGEEEMTRTNLKCGTLTHKP